MIRLMAAFLAGILVTYIVMSNVVNRAGDVNAGGMFAEPEEAHSADAPGGKGDGAAAILSAELERLPANSAAPHRDRSSHASGAAESGDLIPSAMVSTGAGFQPSETGTASPPDSLTGTASEGDDAGPAESGGGAIPVPEELAGLLDEGGRMAQLHRQLESEAEELSWSPYMEAQIAGYLSQKPALAEFSIPLIECRTTLCEVQVIGYGESPMQNWMNATADMRAQPWYEFADSSIGVQQVVPGIIGLMVVMQRAQP